MDYAMARETHVAWVNDASEPAQRVRLHLSGATYIYPLAQLNDWLVESTYERFGDRAWSEPVPRAVVRSRMLGALGLSCRVGAWPAETRRVVREEFARFKTFLHLLRNGYVAHLLPQPDLECPRMAPPVAWEAFQLRSADAAESVLLAFRNVSPDDHVVVTSKGLDPDALFVIEGDGVEPREARGRDLLNGGIRLEASLLASAMATLRRVTWRSVR